MHCTQDKERGNLSCDKVQSLLQVLPLIYAIFALRPMELAVPVQMLMELLQANERPAAPQPPV